ncbi:MAG: AzlC family ABC transporter permease [Chloroflexi bacterium]|nr:AzlC family ABC transporter permease [Chloroflexota bacterium]
MDTTTSVKTRSTKPDWLAGVTQASPIVLGYVPIGLAFGVLAQKAGISTLNTVLMSLLVYAGSSQLIAVGLFASGVPALSIILTTFVVNLRHVLLSAALSPYLKGWRKQELVAFAYELTDESFAVHTVRFASGKPSKAEVLAINATAQVAWIFGSWLGAVVGQSITDVKPLALDYVLPAMFVALLVLQIKDHIQVGVALVTGVLSVGLLLMGVGQWNVIVATLIGATIGMVFEIWIKKRSF